MNRLQFDRLQQKIRNEAPRYISHNQEYLVAIHEAGHAVGFWAISDRIVKKKQRSWERFQRTGCGRVHPPPDLTPKFRIVLRSQDEIEAGPYHDRSGRKIDCDGIVDMEEMDLDTRLELSAGERVKLYAVGLLTGPIAQIHEASLDKYNQDDWEDAQSSYRREYMEAWKVVFPQYGAKRIGKGQMEKLTREAHDLVGNHWTAIEALAVRLVEKRVIESEEAIAIFEASSYPSTDLD